MIGRPTQSLFWEEIRETKPIKENDRGIIIYTRSIGEFIITPRTSKISNDMLSNIFNHWVEYELADRFCPYCMHNPEFRAIYCDECGKKLPKWSRAVLTQIKSCFDGTEMNVSVGTSKVVKQTIPEKKGHSGIGGALAGGLLFGPVGAVAGAAATRNKQTVFKNEERLVLLKMLKVFHL